MISNDAACHGCLIDRFQQALNSEASWPVKWGAQVLEPKNFLHEGVVSRAFVQAYEQKEEEYNCPKDARVYCPWLSVPTKLQSEGEGEGNVHVKAENSRERCQQFVGEKLPESSKNCHGSRRRICRTCQRLSCLVCGGRFEYDSPENSQRCAPIEIDDAAFEGLKRGKDYQVCPSERCGIKVELSEACNAISCRCGTQFCYVCGEPARERSDHWIEKPNGCPKYGQRGAENAQFEVRVRQPGRLRFVLPPPEARIARDPPRERQNAIAYPARRDEDGNIRIPWA